MQRHLPIIPSRHTITPTNSLLVLLLFFLDFWLLLFGICTRHLLLGFRLALGTHHLGGAIDHLSVLDEALDEPMTFAGAMRARVNAGSTEIVIALVADAAVIVFIRHRLVALVAVYGPGGGRRRLFHAEGQFALAGDIRKFGEEV